MHGARMDACMQAMHGLRDSLAACDAWAPIISEANGWADCTQEAWPVHTSAHFCTY